MSDDKKNINYTAADIRKYLSGGMTALEMHAIEKAALDDPFLAEAIEGYEIFRGKDFTEHLKRIEAKIAGNENTDTAPVVKIAAAAWWRAAAVIFLISSTVIIAYMMVNKNTISDQALAKVETAPNTASAPLAELKADTSDSNSIAANQSDAFKNQSDIQSASPEKNNTAAADSFIYQPPATAMQEPDLAATTSAEKVTAGPQQIASLSKEATMKNNQAVADAVQQNQALKEAAQPAQQVQGKVAGVSVLSKDKDANRTPYTYTGQVLKADNTPLAFASVKVINNNSAVAADGEGRFTTTSFDTSIKVEVSALGFSTGRYTIGQQSNINNALVLNESNEALSEVVVTGYGVKRKRSSGSAAFTAVPAEGWENYQQYINKNKIMPQDAEAENVHGTVQLTFTVKNDGSVANIKVQQSLFKSCDEEAIRLIKGGPKWKKNTAKKTRGKISIQF